MKTSKSKTFQKGEDFEQIQKFIKQQVRTFLYCPEKMDELAFDRITSKYIVTVTRVNDIHEMKTPHYIKSKP